MFNDSIEVDRVMAMMRLLALQTVAIWALCCVLFPTLFDAAVAQTTGTISPTMAPLEPLPNQEPRPGDCMPIGLTASGEIVFPFQCKDFIERHKVAKPKSDASGERPISAEKKPVSTEERPAAAERRIPAEDDKAAAPPQSGASDEKPIAAEEKPIPAEVKPAVTEGRGLAEDEKAAARPAESTAADRPQAEQAVKASSRRHVELAMRRHAAGSPGCTRFRTYDPASQTYRSYDGQLRQCR
jgi:hypothetical protein